MFSGQGNGELEICHGPNGFRADIEDNFRAGQLLRTGAMMNIAIYHFGMIRCFRCNRKDKNKEKKHADP